MNEKTYNGWTNYETWVVNLWMDNDEGSYNYNRERAEETYKNAEESGCFTKEEQAALDLSKMLKEEYEDAAQNLLEQGNHSASIWSDLLTAALQEVSWYEIAWHMIEAVDKEEIADDKTP